ncbi:MAG: cation diffusion facilitator family transporter [Candidatus Bathyarchaeia archaeon]
MHSLEDAGLRRTNALKYSTLAIASVFFVEVFLGLISGSLAILSDGLHAFFDTLSSLMLLISVRASLKPPDEEHMYGHEKFESIGGLIGGFTLIVLANIIAAEAISKTFGGKPYLNLDFSLAGYAALGYTLFIDLLRMLIFGSVLGEESPTVKAGFYHALSDLGSTLVALLGFWLSTYGIFYGDSLASLLLSVLLILLSIRLVWNNIMELSDVAPKEAVVKVREEISNVSGRLFACENLKVRKSGGKYFVRATLRVPDYMSLDDAHDLTTKIENNIIKALGDADISFHIEPTGMKGMATEKFIEMLAGKFKGVVGVHDVNVTRYDGKNYVTLHIQVEPSTPLSEAHKLAEDVEKAISKSIGNVGNVLVHIEPSNIELKKGYIIDEEEIDRFVRLSAKKYESELKVKRVITYTANGIRYIDIECIFGKEVPVEEAHRIASEIENIVKEKVSETVVTVHMETENNSD